ncbi:MAG: ATP-dependent zinc protease [Pyrinomonadaceae bacterium]
MASRKQRIIGRREKADFPEIGLGTLNAKIDSGAFTAAIHCCKIEINSEKLLDVVFLDPSHKKYTGEVFTFQKYRERSIRSSNGVSERRYTIETTVRFGEELLPIELSLTFRGDMRFAVLIGRRFLSENRFLIDARKKNYFKHNKIAEIV